MASENLPPSALGSGEVLTLLSRIAAALDRIAPKADARTDIEAADAFVWHAADRRLSPVPRVNRVEMTLLRGIDRVRDTLADNTSRFARGLPANNALLWGARGMGKSSLVKAVHAEINKQLGDSARPLKLVEIHREDIETLPELMGLVRPDPHCFIVFCDDLSFDANDTSYKSLKAVLEGGIEGPARQRDLLRHLEPAPPLAADMMENERSTAINPARRSRRRSRCQTGSASGSASTSAARTSTWRWFLPMWTISASADDREVIRAEALEWATTRGARSGRTAWQYIQDLAGRQERRI
jgi:predicted AAA+ superfamily ATPase